MVKELKNTLKTAKNNSQSAQNKAKVKIFPKEEKKLDAIQTTSRLSAESPQNFGPKDETRKIIATGYVLAFLIIVGASLFFMLSRCYPITDIKDILLAESGILSGPLGFIIGFYFKEELDKKGNTQ